MNHQPTWTLRNPAPKENHNKTQRRTNSKSESPSKPNRDAARIEQHKRGGRPQRSADPVRAIDNQINTAAHARRNQFVDGGIDRGVLAADPCTGQRAEECVAPKIPGESG